MVGETQDGGNEIDNSADKGGAEPYPTRRAEEEEEPCPGADEGEAEPGPTTTPPAAEEPPTTIAQEANVNSKAAAPLAYTGTTAHRLSGQRAVAFTVTHPTQTDFTCPDCQLTYTSHHSLVGMLHKRMTLNITFQCTLCEYTHESLRSTSLHYRHIHGAAVPPTAVVGSNAKACSFCTRSFSSIRLCSMHIRGMHMAEASAQRAREAAERVIQQGASTARTKWTECEIELFKNTLAEYVPSSNVKLAAAIGTRTKEQVNGYKTKFLMLNPIWLADHYHPATPTNRNTRSTCSSSTRCSKY